MSQPPKYYGNPSNSYQPYDTKILADLDGSSGAQFNNTTSGTIEHPTPDSFRGMEDPFSNPASFPLEKSGSASVGQLQARPGYAATSYATGVPSSVSAGPSAYRASAAFEDVLAEGHGPYVDNTPPIASSSSYPYQDFSTPPGLPPPGHRTLSSGSYDSDLDRYGAGSGSKPGHSLTDSATTPLVHTKDTKVNDRRSVGYDPEARGRISQMGEFTAKLTTSMCEAKFRALHHRLSRSLRSH